ncbi:nickel ABC transporter permease subunit NikB [Geomicrobium halophilum]|uniref:Nickel import system permease protein NikB n=1 Tax=Geomicrobium halophilum TaxID=549000 RepID=A0A841PWJ7_9BACL|nr:nickel ABC transporter permease [Geomicrobium halophilum]MBB6448703.1 nickel ABC transporter permease subunit NikB [Geomicrobium halophilum]
MAALIARRILMLFPSLLFLSMFIFLLMQLIPGDPAQAYLRLSQIPPTDEAITAVREELGLDLPLYEQYWNWLISALQLDFGRSFLTGERVLEEVLYYFLATLQLSLTAFLLTIVISVVIGIFAARYQKRSFDTFSRLFSVGGSAIPTFWLGFLLVYFFSYQLGWLPSGGRGDWSSLVLPVLTLSIPYIALFSRLLRTSLLEVSKAYYVTYSRARGLREPSIFRKHILRHALLPLLTVSGVALGYLLAGTVIVESVFSWPGMGRYMVTAITNRDYPVIQFYIVFMAFIFLVVNMMVDWLQAWVDPRLRRREGSRHV